jgi:NitT/TauT family transport system permease protein
MLLLSWSQLFFCLVLWTFSPFRYLPRPTQIYAAAMDMIQNDDLVPHLLTSFILNVEVILVATVVSLFLAYFNTINFFKPSVKTFSNLRYLSMVGLQFFFVLIFTHHLKLSLLVFGVSVFYVTGMISVIESIPTEMYDLAKTMRFNEWRTLWEVVIIGQRDKAFDVLRQNAAIGWMMLTMVEALDRSSGGIGVLLSDSNKHFDLPPVFAIQLIILTLGFCQNMVLGWMRSRTCRYADLTVVRA